MGARSDVVAVLLTAKTSSTVLSESALAHLREASQLRIAHGDPSSWDIRALLEGARACITGWGTPPITAPRRELARMPLLVAHTAGSVRTLLPDARIGIDVRVSHAAGEIAESVAEMTLLHILASLRELVANDRDLRDGVDWTELIARPPGRLLGALTVGLVGSGRTGRAVRRLLAPFGCRVLMTDPYLTPDAALELGVEVMDLETLLAGSDVVSLHAPLLPETEGMIGARELALLRDGALFVNNARGGLVDGAALRSELASGRIRAALDVFPGEPLAPGDPWRTVPNAIVTPHLAGHTLDAHLKQGDAMVLEIMRYLRGEPLHSEITADLAGVMA